MAKTVVINKFDGGLSQDPREHNTNTFVTCAGFDSISKSNTLTPYSETEAEALGTGDITDLRISDVARDTSGYIYGLGRTSAGTPTGNTFIVKSSGTDIASTYSVHANSGAGFAYRPGTLVQYLDGFYYIGSNHNLKKLTFPTTFSTAGTSTFTSSWTNEIIPRPFVHPLKKYLYSAVGNNFARVNDSGTYLNLTSLVLPASLLCSSLTDYGSFLAIAATPTFTGGRSNVYLWDMAEDRTFNESIDWGEGSLMILDNLGGTLVGVSISDANYTSTSTYTTTKSKKLTIRVLNGTQAIKVKEFDVPSTFSLKNFKVNVNGRVYFGGDNSDSLYVITKNSSGNIIVSKDRYLNDVATGVSLTTLRGFNIIGDYLFVGYDTASTTGNFYRTKVTSTYGYDATLTTNINPNMDIGDRSQRKQLKSISVAKTSTTGTVYLQYSYDGGVTFYTIGTALSSIVNKMTNQADGSPFEQGYDYQFKVLSEGGAEITELKYSYEVIPELI